LANTARQEGNVGPLGLQATNGLQEKGDVSVHRLPTQLKRVGAHLQKGQRSRGQFAAGSRILRPEFGVAICKINLKELTIQGVRPARGGD